jgi:hypothetical protein
MLNEVRPKKCNVVGKMHFVLKVLPLGLAQNCETLKVPLIMLKIFYRFYVMYFMALAELHYMTSIVRRLMS